MGLSRIYPLARRSTLSRPEWIQSPLEIVVEVRNREKSMSKEKRHRTIVTVRFTDEEYDVLTHLCALKKTSRTAYLARLATSHAKQELLTYAAREYQAGQASLSELATKTGLDVPTIMEEVARITEEKAESGLHK